MPLSVIFSIEQAKEKIRESLHCITFFIKKSTDQVINLLWPNMAYFHRHTY